MLTMNGHNTLARTYLEIIVTTLMISGPVSSWNQNNSSRVPESSGPGASPVKSMNPEMVTIGDLYHNPRYSYRSVPDTRPRTTTTDEKCIKRILIYTNQIVGAEGIFPCADSPCGIDLKYEANVTALRESDAVILFHRTLWTWEELHINRPLGQPWVFYSRESPINTREDAVPPFGKFFRTSYNYTMSYRADSDFFAMYGRYAAGVASVSPSDDRNWSEGKTKLVAWMASNCDRTSWGRMEFVRNLARFIRVDTYGACGMFYCSPDFGCSHEMRQYKFYLSLENSECRDYITEKLWRNAYSNDLVPVVYGPPKSDYERLAPPNSFIYVTDFKTMKALAKYLYEVSTNDELYNKYFEWRKFGSIVDIVRERELFSPTFLCPGLVKRLMDVDEGRERLRTSPNMNRWWRLSCKINGRYPNVTLH